MPSGSAKLFKPPAPPSPASVAPMGEAPMPDFLTFTRLALRHDAGGLLATLMIFALVGAAMKVL
ncbi:hypothetical protein [Synechococcus phage Yong-M3-232]|nr:hypothetical protein [Synechococcus phage Yong-M3-232]